MSEKTKKRRPARPVPHVSVKAFVTDNSGQRHARNDKVLVATSGTPDAVIAIDVRDPMQSILGFGTSFTEASCHLLSQLKPAVRLALLDDLFSPAKNNFSVSRLCIGASDYATKMYSYNEGSPDPSLERFSIDHDRATVLPVLKQARNIRPDLYLISSPWSPPGWMKYGDSMLGGSIRPQSLPVYAQYILRYLQAYAAAGVNVDAITIQNESDADQAGKMPACTWSEEVEATYIAEHLGPVLAQSDQHPQVWILDHNYNLVGRVLDHLAIPKLRRFVHGIAWHGYVGTPDQMMVAQRQYPDMNMHWTEGGDDYRSPTILTAWARWAQQFAGILNYGCRSITTWNLALDEVGRPNIGPFSCAGLITIDSKSLAITRNGIFWALAHFARAITRGSQVLRCGTSEHVHLATVAARRPDDSLAVIVSNSGPDAEIRLDILDKTGTARSQQISVSENSVTTILLY